MMAVPNYSIASHIVTFGSAQVNPQNTTFNSLYFIHWSISLYFNIFIKYFFDLSLNVDNKQYLICQALYSVETYLNPLCSVNSKHVEIGNLRYCKLTNFIKLETAFLKHNLNFIGW